MSDSEIIQIYTQSGHVKVLCFLNDTIDEIIKKVLKEDYNPSYFGIQTAENKSRNIVSGNQRFLCPRLPWCHLKLLFGGDGIFLSIRNYPLVIDDTLNDSLLTGQYLINQLISQYDSVKSEINNLDIAIELSCLVYYKKLKPILSSKNTSEIKEIFPSIVLDRIKIKNLKKLIQPKISEIENLSEHEYCRKLYTLFQQACSFDQDEFKCFYGAGEGIPVTMFIGPRIDICIKVGSDTRVIDYFIKIESIICSIINDGELCQIKLLNFNEPDPIVFTFTDIDEADNFVHLLDSYTDYQKLKSNCPLIQAKCPKDFINIPEIDKSRVKREKILDSGQFGDVYKGTFKQVNDESVAVAVKLCKAECTDEERKLFLAEAEIMQLIEHPHIVQLFGIAQGQEIWIVMEFCKEGQLLCYLIDHRRNLNEIELLAFCYQLATAMSYLESQRIVHRDIAARNVLLSNSECAKLCDFGKAVYLGDNEYYQGVQQEMLPVKWSALESLSQRIFSSASDVWSFGVLVWEVMSGGRKPYTELNNNEVYAILRDNKRLPRLPNVTESLHMLLMACWATDPSRRPAFGTIKNKLNDVKIEMKKMQAEGQVISMAAGLNRKPPQKPRFGASSHYLYNQKSGSNSAGSTSNSTTNINQSMPDLMFNTNHMGSILNSDQSGHLARQTNQPMSMMLSNNSNNNNGGGGGGSVMTSHSSSLGNHRYQKSAAPSHASYYRKNTQSGILSPQSNYNRSLIGRSGSQDNTLIGNNLLETEEDDSDLQQLHNISNKLRLKIQSFADTISLGQSCSVAQLKALGLDLRRFLQELEFIVPGHPREHVLTERECDLIQLYKRLIRIRISNSVQDNQSPSSSSSSQSINSPTVQIMIEKMLDTCGIIFQHIELLIQCVIDYLSA